MSFLCSVLRLPSQQNSSSLVAAIALPYIRATPPLSLSLCSEPQNQAPFHITAKHSLGVSSHPSLTYQSTLTALAKQPFYVPQTPSIDTASHAYQLRQLANGKAKQTTELSIKEASFPRSKHSDCGHQTHNPRPGGPQPKFHIPTQGNF